MVNLMSEDDDDTDDIEEDTAEYSAPAADPVLIALELCKLANNKTAAAALKKLRRLDRQYADTQAKVAALAAQAEQRNAALVQREAELAARERALDEREASFASQATEVRDELHGHHARLEQTNRQLVHRILSCSGLLAEWNPNLQPLPSWQQLRRMIADLPDDLPAAPTAEVVSENVREDWAGSVFMPASSLTRTVRGASGEQRS